MKLLRHITLLLLICAALAALVACGGGSDDTDTHYCYYSDWVTVTEADCENDGLREKTCSGCGAKETEIIEAYGHTYSSSLGAFAPDGEGFVYQQGCLNGSCTSKNTFNTNLNTEEVGPTCETAGKLIKTYSVVIDGITYSHTVETVIDAIDHNYSYATGTWTWNGYGEATYTVRCRMNGAHTYTYTAEISSETTPATCTANGVTVHTASVTVDGVTYTESKNQTINKINHNYDYGNGEWVWDGTECATYVVYCENDPSHTVTAESNSTASSTSSPTCEAGAITTYTVRVFMNGAYYTDTKTVETEPLGHDYKAETAAWQWYDEGRVAQLTFTCNNGTPHTAEYDAEVEYTYTVIPDCENGGLAHAKATVVLDGVTYTDERDYEVGPIDHELDWENGYVEWDGYNGASIIIPCTLGEPHNFTTYIIADHVTVNPDCNEDGYELYTIETELYGYPIYDEQVVVLPATGHDYEITEVTWLDGSFVSVKIDFICKNDYRHTDSELGIADGVTTVAPTCTLSGEALYTATVEKGEQSFTVTTTGTLEKTGHSFLGSTCYYCGIYTYSEGLDYELNEDGTGYVLKGLGEFTGTILSIPATHEGLPVVGIKSEAFKGNSTIKELYVSENIVTIEYAAFIECTSLEKIHFTANEHGLLDIRSYAFAYCTSLKTLDIGNYVKKVRETAFGGCSSLTSVRIAAKNIYDGAFSGCPLLHSIEILDGVEYVGNIINEYTPIYSLTIPSTVKNINTALFSNIRLVEVKNLSKVNIATTSTLLNVYTDSLGESCLYTDPATGYVMLEMGSTRYLIGHSGVGDSTVLPEACNGNSYIIYQYALMDVDFKHQPLYIPDAVTMIYRYAAYCNETLTVIWGCANVTDIGVYAFSGCSELLSVTLGAKINKIYDYAFNGCDKVCELINHSSINVQGGKIPMFLNLIDEIKDPTVNTPAIYFVEDDFVFYYRGEKCYLVSYFGAGDEALPGQLTLPDLPRDWEIRTYGIHKHAIGEIDGVTKIKLSSSVNQICSEAFLDSFEEIEIPVISSLKRIEDKAFKWTAIESIFLPSSLEYIGKNAFPSDTLKSATFACSDGWKIEGITGSMTDVDPDNLSDSSKAARYLLSKKNYHIERILDEG